MSFEPSSRDRVIVTEQLGRPPKARWRVASRCHLGVPMVLENHPVLPDGSPFPTRFWLTCPVLVKRVSRLEAAGALGEVTADLALRPDLRGRLAESLRAYVAGRDEMASIEASGAPPGGGPDKVKCLHAHVAHELAAGINPVGALTLERTGWPDCRIPCVEVEERS